MDKIISYTKTLKGSSSSPTDTSSDPINTASLQIQQVTNLSQQDGGYYTNVTVDGGYIDNVKIGSVSPSTGIFTNLNSGTPGNPYTTYFAGNDNNHFFQWQGPSNTLTVAADDIKLGYDNTSIIDIGHYRFTANLVTTIYTDESMIFTPNGAGDFDVNSLGTINLLPKYLNANSFSTGTIQTTNGNLILGTEINLTSHNDIQIITNQTDGTIAIVFNQPHLLSVGDTITFSNTDCTPSIDGQTTVYQVIDNRLITILPSAPLTAPGSHGSMIKTRDKITEINTLSINLNADCPIIWNSSNNCSIEGTSDSIIELTSSDSVRIVNAVPLEFSSNLYSLNFDGASFRLTNKNTTIPLILDAALTQITGDLNILGNTEISSALNVSFADPIISIAQSPTLTFQDKGHQFFYLDSNNVKRLGFIGWKQSLQSFVIYQNATNTNEVISGTLASLQLGAFVSSSVSAPSNNNLGLSGMVINLNASNYVIIPTNIPFYFGSNLQTFLKFNGNFFDLNTQNYPINLSTSSSVNIPQGTLLNFNGASGNTNISAGSSGQMFISSPSEIALQSTQLRLTSCTPLTWNSSQTCFIQGCGVDLTVSAMQGNIFLSSLKGAILPLGSSISFSSSGTAPMTDYILHTNPGLNISTAGQLQQMVQTYSLNSLQQITIASSSSSISLSPFTVVSVPFNKPIQFGQNTFIKEAISAGRLQITSSIFDLTPVSSSVQLSTGVPIYFSSMNSTSIFSASETQLNISSSGTIYIQSPTTNITGNLIVSGTTTTINSTTVTINDPVFTLVANPVTVADGKWRGIESNYYNSKLLFFGVDPSNLRFTYYSDATDNNNVISGIRGDFEMSNLFIIGGGINLGNGSISNCVGLSSNSTLNITSPNSIQLSTPTVQIPANSNLNFGSNANINSSVQGQLNIVSNSTYLNSAVNTVVTSPLMMLANQPIQFGSTSASIFGNGNGNLTTQWNGTWSWIPLSSASSVQYGNLYFQMSTNSNNDAIISVPNGTLLINSNYVQIPNGISLNNLNTSTIGGGNGDLSITSGTNLVIIKNNLSLSGSITNATWQGQPISLANGGTGNTSWQVGSVVFSSSSSLTQDNSNFYYDTSTKRLGIRSNTPSEAFEIGGSSHQSFVAVSENDRNGIFFKTSTSQIIWSIERVSSYLSFYSSASGVSNPGLLSPVLILSATNNCIGVGYSNSSSLINGFPLQVNGSAFISSAIQIGAVCNLQITNNNLSVISTGSIILNANSNIKIPSDIPILFNTTLYSIVYSSSLNSLHVSSSTSVLLDSPLISLYEGSAITFSSNSNTVSLSSSTTGNHDFNFTQSSGSFVFSTGVNQGLCIGSTGRLVFDQSSQAVLGDQINKNNSGLFLQTSLVQTSSNSRWVQADNATLTFGPFSNGSQITYIMSHLNHTELLFSAQNNIALSPGQAVKLPNNIPIIYGGNGSENIYGNGSQLFLNGYDGVVISSNAFIQGTLTVAGSTVQVDTITQVTQSCIFEIGGQQILTVTSLSNYSSSLIVIQVTTVHNLIIGDTVIISDSNSVPTYNGTYSIISIPTNMSFTISGQLTTSGSIGQAQTALTTNPGCDVGIEFHCHDNSTGTAGARNGFFGIKNNSNIFSLFIQGVSPNQHTFNQGVLGDLVLNTLYPNFISAFTLTGTLSGGGSIISGSNFLISGGSIASVSITQSSVSSSSVLLTGGSIDGIPIGSSVASSGRFTSIAVSSSVMVNNLNSNYIGGYNSSQIVLTNGSNALSQNWNAGNFQITTQNLYISSLSPNRLCFTNTQGSKIVDDAGLTFNPSSQIFSISGSLSVAQLASNINCQNYSLSNANIISSVITTTNIDVSLSTITFANQQIPLVALQPGTANISISGNASTVSNGLYTLNYDQDNCMLKADTAFTPSSFVVGPDQFVGRYHSNPISALSIAQVQEMLQVSPGASGDMHSTGASMTGNLNYSFERVSFSAPSNTSNLSSSVQISYVSVLGASGNSAQGIIPNGTSDGQTKIIIMSSLATNTNFQLLFDNISQKLVDATGQIGQRTLSFSSAGQSVQLLWDNILQSWFIIGGSGSLIS